jgi:hypothetical protein
MDRTESIRNVFAIISQLPVLGAGIPGWRHRGEFGFRRRRPGVCAVATASDLVIRERLVACRAAAVRAMFRGNGHKSKSREANRRGWDSGDGKTETEVHEIGSL